MADNEDVTVTEMDFGSQWEAAQTKANEALGIEPEENLDENIEAKPAKASAPDDDDAGTVEDSGNDEETPEPEVDPGDTDEPRGNLSAPSPEQVTELKALAEKYGYKMDSGQITVSTGERAAHRQKMARDKQNAESLYNDYREKLNEQGAQLEKKYEKAMKMQAAIDEGDYEAMAKVWGAESYFAMNKAFIAKRDSPQFKEHEALKAKVAAMEASQQSARDEQAQVAQAAQHKQDQSDWYDEIGGYLAENADPVIKKMAGEPNFRLAVDNVVNKHNGDISIDQAAAQALESLRADYGNMGRYLTPATEDIGVTPVDGASIETTRKTNKRSPKVISQKEASHDSDNVDPDDIDAMQAKYTRMINRSDDSQYVGK